MKRSNKAKDHLFLAYLSMVLAAFFWGGSFIASKYALREASPFLIITTRFLIASIIFIPIICYYAYAGNRIAKKDLWKILAIGTLNVPVYFILEILALSYTTAMNVSMLITIVPIIVALLSRRFLKENLGWIKISGIILAFIGVIIIITQGSFNLQGDAGDLTGGLLALSAVFVASIFMMLSKKWMKDYNPVMFTGSVIIAGTLVMLVISAFTTDLSLLWQLSPASWTGILYLAIFCSFLAYTLQYYALSKTTATQTTTIGYGVPIFTTLIAVVFLNEALTESFAIGGVMTLFGVFLVMKS